MAIVHDVVDTYVDTIPWLVAEDDTLNWFKVHWSGDYPGSSEVSSIGTASLFLLFCSLSHALILIHVLSLNNRLIHVQPTDVNSCLAATVCARQS